VWVRDDLFMQGRAEDQQELLDAESVVGHLMKPGSVFAFLAGHRKTLFPDQMFADLFPSGRGRPSVPAEVMASVIVLQTLHGLSDSETTDALTFDLRWKAAIGWPLTAKAFHDTTLTYWRQRLLASNDPNRIFAVVQQVIAQTGVLKGKTRRALDSTVLDDAVATQDTVTQLIAAVRRVRRLVPGADVVVAEVTSAHDYDDPSKPMIAWDDKTARDGQPPQRVRIDGRVRHEQTGGREPALNSDLGDAEPASQARDRRALLEQDAQVSVAHRAHPPDAPNAVYTQLGQGGREPCTADLHCSGDLHLRVPLVNQHPADEFRVRVLSPPPALRRQGRRVVRGGCGDRAVAHRGAGHDLQLPPTSALLDGLVEADRLVLAGSQDQRPRGGPERPRRTCAYSSSRPSGRRLCLRRSGESEATDTSATTAADVTSTSGSPATSRVMVTRLAMLGL